MTARVRATAEIDPEPAPDAGPDPQRPTRIGTEHRNEVIVAGRLAAPGLSRQLPSGDEIVTWRLVVDRVTSAAGARRVDVVDCTAFGARVRRQSLGWHEDDVIEVVGALRRRFWRGPGGLQSRCEVEVETARRVRAMKPQSATGDTVRRRRMPG
jgi:single-strand DNA-binding protein